MATTSSGTQGGREKEKIPLTREGYEEKKKRLHFLITERRPQVADYIHDAKEAGDISESSAYEDAKNLQAMLEGEIQELHVLLDNAVILETPEQSDGKRVVRLGAMVELENSRGEAKTYQLVSTVEA
ncbi:MAG: GreA/GreB family elongation factor, partial [Ktedonobacterales bacterium]